MRYCAICFVMLLLFACSGKEDQVEKKTSTNSDAKVVVPTTKNIEVLFNETTFQESESLPLLRELGFGICNPKEKDLTNYVNPSCNPKFFKFFPIKKDTPIKNAFALLIKARVHDFPIRRTFIYSREKGELIKVNGFAANLIGMKKSKTAYDDLILRFNDEFQNHFNCIYTWRNNHYEFDKVAEINDSAIKKEFQDSMNVEIHKFIETNGMQKL